MNHYSEEKPDNGKPGNIANSLDELVAIIDKKNEIDIQLSEQRKRKQKEKRILVASICVLCIFGVIFAKNMIKYTKQAINHWQHKSEKCEFVAGNVANGSAVAQYGDKFLFIKEYASGPNYINEDNPYRISVCQTDLQGNNAEEIYQSDTKVFAAELNIYNDKAYLLEHIRKGRESSYEIVVLDLSDNHIIETIKPNTGIPSSFCVAGNYIFLKWGNKKGEDYYQCLGCVDLSDNHTEILYKTDGYFEYLWDEGYIYIADVAIDYNQHILYRLNPECGEITEISRESIGTGLINTMEGLFISDGKLIREYKNRGERHTLIFSYDINSGERSLIGYIPIREDRVLESRNSYGGFLYAHVKPSDEENGSINRINLKSGKEETVISLDEYNDVGFLDFFLFNNRIILKINGDLYFYDFDGKLLGSATAFLEM